MSFRDDGDALRNRVESLEDELARTKDEAERLRQERDRALAPSPHRLDTRPGTRLWVEWRGTWWAATVVHEVGGGRVRIHYDGWSTRWDENVTLARMATRDRPPPGPRGGLVPSMLVMLVLVLLVVGAGLVIALGRPSTPVSPPGVALLSSAGLAPNAHVWVRWGSTWYDGTVIEVIDDVSVRVHYVGWSDADDEIVPVDRVRRR